MYVEAHKLTRHRNEAAKKAPRLIPPFWQLLGFSVFFGTGAYMIDHGDVLNGSGVISGTLTVTL